MKITGELLKAERIKRDLSVQDVAYALKLSSRTIQAIEAGQLEELPAKTFVRGFVKSYSDYLKLDTNSVLKQFQEEMGSTHPVPKTPPPGATDHLQKENQTHGTKNIFSQSAEGLNGAKLETGMSQKNIFYFAAVAGLVILIVIINKVANHYQNEIPPQDVQTVATTETLSAQSGTVVGGVPSALPGEIESASATTTTGVELGTTTSASTTASNTVVAPSTTTATLPVEKSNGKPVEVLIEAKKDASIEYAKGNTTNFKKINIRANTYQIIKSTSGLHLRTSDGGLLNITVNGINKGTMSSSNKTVEMTF